MLFRQRSDFMMILAGRCLWRRGTLRRLSSVHFLFILARLKAALFHELENQHEREAVQIGMVLHPIQRRDANKKLRSFE
jgi:hypothetical protein